MNSKPRFYNILAKIILSAEDQINRDLNELSLLQSSKNLPYNFANKLPEIIKKTILYKAEYLLPDYGIIYNNSIIKEPEEKENFVVINILPELENLLRSIPFISCSAFIADLDSKLEVKNIEASFIFLPIYNKIIWADKSLEQSFAENRKLKTSQVIEIERANICNKINNNGINLNSTNYEICMLAEAKLDVFIAKYENELDFRAAELIANMAGAISFIDRKNKIVKIVANKDLFEKLKNE